MNNIAGSGPVLALLLMATATAADLQVMNLKCEHRADPLGIDTPRPRLSWRLESSRRGEKQTAYRVLVAESPKMLADDKGNLWDSGRVESDRSIHVVYAGKPLPSRMSCWWKVRVWDKDREASAWSRGARWTMGLLRGTDWQGRWIGMVDRPAGDPANNGYLAGLAKTADELKWVQVDLGSTQPIARVRLRPCYHYNPHIDQMVAGFSFPVRMRIDISDDPQFGTFTTIADHTQADYPNPGRESPAFDTGGRRGRYVRVTATRLWDLQATAEPFCFGLAELEVFSGGKNVAHATPVSAKDSVENWGWAKKHLTDGYFGTLDRDAEQAAVLLRKQLSLAKPLVRATAHVCGLGSYELLINGSRVGRSVLDPGWTNYRKSCPYVTYDVTEHLRQGENAVGVMLGNGMYNVIGGRYVKFRGSFGPPKMILQLDVEFADGTSTHLVSDASWRVATGPITFNCIYGGEDYDARLEQPGWDRPGFDDSTWREALVVDGPGGRLVSRKAPPIEVTQTFKPVAVTQPKPGVYVFDLGQNFSGWPQLSLRGPAGAKVQIIPGELLAADGTVTQGNTGGPAYFTYVLKGEGTQTWHPRLSYYGFRYLQIQGAAPNAAEAASGKPLIVDVNGQFLHAAVERVGRFSCSNEMLNQIHALIIASIRSNLQSVLTDCPHREKLGWLMVPRELGPSLMYNYDVATFFTKILGDMGEAQTPEGLVPGIAPEYVVFDGAYRDCPGLGSDYLFDAWYMYQWYGDQQVLADHYQGMKRYVDYLTSRSKERLILYPGLGDWCDFGPGAVGFARATPVALTETAYYYYDVVLLEKIAKLLGKTADARKYGTLARNVFAAFNEEFFDPTTNQYATGSQAANATPLVFGMVATDRRPTVLENVVADVRSHGNHLTAGATGFRCLLLALAEAGRSDVIFDMMTQTNAPSYGYQIAQGATALTETWDAARNISHNHCMLGQAEEWFYHDLAGIQLDPTATAFEKIVIKPQIVGDLTWVKADYRSIRGTITSNWHRKGGRLTLEVAIPAGTTATIHVPATDARNVTENGKSAEQAQGVKLLRAGEVCRGEVEADVAVYQVGSGTYRFEVQP